jgi:hypothetical protein
VGVVSGDCYCDKESLVEELWMSQIWVFVGGRCTKEDLLVADC